MNKYAEIARQHWTRTDPARVQAMADPETFFRELGEQVESQVQALATQLAGPDQPGEEYLQKVGRLNMARLQAEEAVMTDLVWISGPQSEEEAPATDWVSETMRAIHDADPDNEPPWTEVRAAHAGRPRTVWSAGPRERQPPRA